MTKGLLKYKHLVLLGVFMGIVSFSVCHASAMPQSMDGMPGMDCQVQTICTACPVPVVAGFPGLSNFLTQFEILPEKSPFLSDPLKDSFYHPPR